MDSHKDLMTTNYQRSQAGAESRLLLPDSVPGPDDYFVTVQWLHQALENHGDDLVLVDVTRGAGNYPLDEVRLAEDYVKGHIPGALHLNTDELGGFKDYFKPTEDLRDVFLSKGIRQDTTVVFYSVYARDILYIASRVAFAAYYLGVDQVKILDGGLQAWVRAGYPLETGENQPHPVEDFGCPVPKRPDIYVRTPDDLLDRLKKEPNLVMASVRTWNEYLGVNAGHAWNKGAGEIAGAMYAGDDLLANELGELAHPEVYLDQWASWGIHPQQSLLVYCGTSWRSSTAFFVMKTLGWPRVRMFDGSWHKWYLAHEEEPARYPIQRGNPKGEPRLEIYPQLL